MIQRNKSSRLGAQGAFELKQHPWLVDFPWDDLNHKLIKAPFNPHKLDNFDAHAVQEEWKDIDDPDFKENLGLLTNPTV